MTKQIMSTALAEAFNKLIQSAQRHGRDVKLIVALLDALTAMLLHQSDALFPSELRIGSAATAGTAANSPPSKRAARSDVPPQVKARLVAVIDSLSDDEAAWFLGIGVRQVRRRRSKGQLYFFEVGRKKRYPLWQFTDHRTLLPGLREVIAAIPSWLPPERTQRLMTTARASLRIDERRSDPISWLLNGGDPQMVVRLLRSLK